MAQNQYYFDKNINIQNKEGEKINSGIRFFVQTKPFTNSEGKEETKEYTGMIYCFGNTIYGASMVLQAGQNMYFGGGEAPYDAFKSNSDQEGTENGYFVSDGICYIAGKFKFSEKAADIPTNYRTILTDKKNVYTGCKSYIAVGDNISLNSDNIFLNNANLNSNQVKFRSNDSSLYLDFISNENMLRIYGKKTSLNSENGQTQNMNIVMRGCTNDGYEMGTLTLYDRNSGKAVTTPGIKLTGDGTIVIKGKSLDDIITKVREDFNNADKGIYTTITNLDTSIRNDFNNTTTNILTTIGALDARITTLEGKIK